jgi:hypothetical protein
MVYPKEFFTLIYKYALKYSEISNEDILEVILNRTPFYYAIGNHSWETDNQSKLWLEYVQGIKEGKSPDTLAYEMYMSHLEEYPNMKYFGCFRYHYVIDKEGDPVVKLHFENYDKSPYGPLSKERKDYRIKDLKEMFSDIKKKHPDTQYVQGGSWLYNYESYKRLFPKTYTTDMPIGKKVNTSVFVIWGPFVNSEGQLKEDMVNDFLKKIETAKTTEELLDAFPLKGYFPKGKIEDFYTFYGI